MSDAHHHQWRRVPHLGPAFRFVALAAAAMLAPRPARGQQPRPYPLGEIVVSARRPVSEEAATVRVVTAADIRAAGARTLDEALALLPGIDVRTGDAGVPRIDMRGFRPRHLLLLLDGVPLNSTYDGQADPSFIPVEEIAEIKLEGGTASVLYGQGGLGGVINIITRRGDPGVSGSVGGEARDGNGHLARGTVEGGRGPFSGFVSTSAVRSDGYPTRLAGGSSFPRENSARDRTNLFGSATWRPERNVHVGLILSHVAGSYGIPPTLSFPANDPFAVRPSYERISDLAGTTAQLAAGIAGRGPLQARGWAYSNALGETDLRYDDSTYTSLADSTVKGTYRETSHTRLSGAGAQLTWSAGRAGGFTLALDGERDRWTLDGIIRDVPVSAGGGSGGRGGGGGGGAGGGGGGVWATRPITGDRTLGRYGAALEYDVWPVPALGLTAGVAHDWLTRSEAGTLGASAFGGGVAWSIGGTRLRASAARKFRFPTIRQLYDASGGNPDLRSEYADEVEIGIERTLPAASSIGLTVFRTDVHGYIGRASPGEPFTNHAAYRFAGAELTGETHPVRRLLLRATYSYLDARDRSPGAGDVTIQYEPRNKATAEARYDLETGLSLAASAMRVSGEVYNSRQTPLRQGTLPAYTLVSARASQRLLHGRLDVYAGADNLLDAAYEDEYGFPRIARVVYVGADVAL